jgi:DNA polymerase
VRPEVELSRDDRTQRLAVLNESVKQCQRCSELASSRQQTVFGVGNPEARIVFIGEAPGADEDTQGEPFVGRAGQLLNKIVEACGMKREDVYICNILKCRPPGNRTPAPDECTNCREYLLGQLATIDPEYIVCWGTVAAQNLLSMDWTIGKMRKRFYQFGRAKVLCTYHPSYLLRNPAAKKDVWEDMKLLFADMGKTLTP